MKKGKPQNTPKFTIEDHRVIDQAVQNNDVLFFEKNAFNPNRHVYALEQSIRHNKWDIYKFLHTHPRHKNQFSSEITITACQFDNVSVLQDILQRSSPIFDVRLLAQTLKPAIEEGHTQCVQQLCEHFVANPSVVPNKDSVLHYLGLALLHNQMNSMQAIMTVKDISGHAYKACLSYSPHSPKELSSEDLLGFLKVLTPHCTSIECSGLWFAYWEHRDDTINEEILDFVLQQSCPKTNAYKLHSFFDNPYLFHSKYPLLKEVFEKSDFNNDVLYQMNSNLMEMIVENGRVQWIVDLAYDLIPKEYIDLTLSQLDDDQLEDPLWQDIQMKRQAEKENEILTSSVKSDIRQSNPSKKM